MGTDHETSVDGDPALAPDWAKSVTQGHTGGPGLHSMVWGYGDQSGDHGKTPQ